MANSFYSGLTAFKKGAGEAGFEVVSNLAEELPTVSNDGKTYTFKLRKGVKFSDGRDVTVKDVVGSFQRIFKVSSPTSGGFYSVIVGADACINIFFNGSSTQAWRMAVKWFACLFGPG